MLPARFKTNIFVDLHVDLSADVDLYNTRDRTQDTSRCFKQLKSKILPRYCKIQDSKNIFVDLLQAMLPRTDQCLFRLSAEWILTNVYSRYKIGLKMSNVKTKSKILQDPRSYQEIQDRFQEYICRTCRSSASNASSN